MIDKFAIKQISEFMLLSVEELEKNLYGKSAHFDYLNGKVAIIKVLLENVKYINCDYDARIILDFCQEAVMKIAQEQYGSVPATYITFDGSVNVGRKANE